MRSRELLAAMVVGGALFVAAPGSAGAQGVAVAPQVIIIDGRTRTTPVTLVNLSDTPTDVTLSTAYGYPVTDAWGMMVLKTFDVVSDTAPSAMGWIQLFPQKFRLAPRARKTIRLLITPPKNVQQREYWARLVVASRGGKVEVRNVSSGFNNDISVGLNLEIRSVLPIYFRNGAVTTGVRMDVPRARLTRDTLFARALLTRTGTAAYVGTLTASLKDVRGKIVRTGILPLGVYYTLDPSVSVPIAGVPAGRYTLELSLESARPDVARPLLVQAPSVERSISVLVP